MNFKVCPKKPRSQQFSGFSSEMGVANSVVMTCPETYVDPSVNPLNTKLSCWNFNLVNADYFSHE